MGILATRATGRGIAHLGAIVAVVLMLAVTACAQQAPAKRATAPTEPGLPCVRLALRMHGKKRDVCLPAGRQGAIPQDAKAANLKLIGLAPVNPTALAKTIGPASAKSSPKASAAQGSSTMEFQVASGDAQSQDGNVVKKSKQKFLKAVHGEAYGTLAPGLDGGQTAGAAVGASSKGGNTHIFIETNHNGDSSPR